MTKAEVLEALRFDLGITTDYYDDRLSQIIEAADKAITKEGVTLDYSDIEHVQMVVEYSSWMWRKRDTGEGMPRMVRYHLNQLIFHQHLQDQEPTRVDPEEESEEEK